MVINLIKEELGLSDESYLHKRILIECSRLMVRRIEKIIESSKVRQNELRPFWFYIVLSDFFYLFFHDFVVKHPAFRGISEELYQGYSYR